MSKKRSLVPVEQIERCIYLVCGQRVMLDSDLAELYGVPTHRLNEQVRRNRKRFPEDFAFQLTQQEFMNLISQIAISSSTHGGRRKRPWAFTEHGVAMLSSVLHSQTAIQVNVQIIRTFVRLWRLLATPGELVEQLTKLAETVKLHDEHFRVHDEEIKVITRVLQKLMEPPPEKPKGKIGFQTPESSTAPESSSTPGSD